SYYGYLLPGITKSAGTMSRNEINAIVHELTELQLELKEDRSLNKQRFEPFQQEMKRLNEQDHNLSYKLDKAIDRIKALMKKFNS
ncbi:MAG: hypothetical protein AAGA85_06075, partial [Bacteroidota bacterium]